ncbi:MAG TPA: MEDS domain-containing protein [Gemmatimonadales bacterium]|nr:MEDS domain-containing protein [Gemmatimonadales bacterium]
MAVWGDVLDEAGCGEHLVQLYGGDDQLLCRNVSRYLAEGLRRGDAGVVVATVEHAATIRRLLQQDQPVSNALRAPGLMFLDAANTLDRFTVNGEPERGRFQQVIGGVLREAQARSTSGRVRAFGEMVALLWGAGRRESAILLEGLWNELLADGSFSLFCAYPLDILSAGSDLGGIDAVLRSHTQMCAGRGTMLFNAKASGAGSR